MKTRRFLVIAFCAFVAALCLTFGVRRFATFGPLAGHIIPAAPQLSPLIRSLRPSYPYSVIPGGAYSAAELHYANQTDAVVRTHYASFDMKLAHIVQLTDDRFQYASYRIKDQIYWTRKKLRIRKGEYLLTDGVAFARTRCGNRLSEAPQVPVSPREPAVALLSMPPFRPEMLPALELAQSPPLGELAEASPRLAPVLPNSFEGVPATEQSPLPPNIPQAPLFPVTPPVARRPPPSFSPPPPANQPPPILPVPEPSTVGLFLITFCIALWGMTRVLPARKPEHPAE